MAINKLCEKCHLGVLIGVLLVYIKLRFACHDKNIAFIFRLISGKELAFSNNILLEIKKLIQIRRQNVSEYFDVDV